MENNNYLVQISQAVEIIKTAILQSQERTIKNANADVLALNYAVGGFISQQSKLHQWGSGIVKSISEKLQRDMPGLRGFGYESLKKMRQFYESWTPYIIGSPSATQLHESEIGSPVATQIALPKLQMSFSSSAQEIEKLTIKGKREISTATGGGRIYSRTITTIYGSSFYPSLLLPAF